MPYPNMYEGYLETGTEPLQGTTFDVPVEIVLTELSWLLADQQYSHLELLMMSDFEEVEDLRAEILVHSSQFSSKALNKILEEIDRVVDEYRRGVALL